MDRRFGSGIDGGLVHLMRADDNGAGCSGAGMFAGTAADTEIGFDDRHGKAIAPRDHFNGCGGAMFGAGSAGGMFLMDDAEMLIELGNAQLDQFFFGEGQRLEGGSRADLHAPMAFVGAGSGVKVHAWLEKAGEAILEESGLEDPCGALGKAQAARGAEIMEAPGGAGTGWCQRGPGSRVVFGWLAPALTPALSEAAATATPLLLGNGGKGSGEHGGSGGEKGAAGTEARLKLLSLLRLRF